MRMAVILFINIVLVVCCGGMPAGADDGHDVYQNASKRALPHINRHFITSNSLQETRAIDIALPVNYQETADTHKYPVIVVMDGELMFPMVSGLVHQMTANSQMPDSIVIGIYNAAGKRRSITPKPFNREGKPYWFGGKENDYLDFLKAEVLPFVEGEYRAADFRTLIGLSPTANFTLHAFWKAPDVFDAYVAINSTDFTAVGYEGETVFSKITDTLTSGVGEKRFLYLSMPQAGVSRNPQIAEAYTRLDEQLRGLGGDRILLKTDVIEKSAYAATLPAVMNALEMIFPAKKWDPDFRNFILDKPGQSLEALKTYFANLSGEYGFTALPKGERFYNRSRIKRLGYYMLQNDRAQEAADVFKYWITLYPNSANAYDSLADVQDKLGLMKDALASRQKAVELAKRNNDFRLSHFEEKLLQADVR